MMGQLEQNSQATSRDSDHLFRLRPCNLDSVVPMLEYDFSPKSLAYASNDSEQVLSLTPRFCKDPASWNHGFESGVKAAESLPKAELSRVQTSFRTIEEQRAQIWQAKPRANYCQICREYFHEYAQHIENPIHIKKTAKSAVSDQEFQHLFQILRRQTRSQPVLSRPSRDRDENRPQQHGSKRRIHTDDRSGLLGFSKVSGESQVTQPSRFCPSSKNPSALTNPSVEADALFQSH